MYVNPIPYVDKGKKFEMRIAFRLLTLRGQKELSLKKSRSCPWSSLRQQSRARKSIRSTRGRIRR